MNKIINKYINKKRFNVFVVQPPFECVYLAAIWLVRLGCLGLLAGVLRPAAWGLSPAV